VKLALALLLPLAVLARVALADGCTGCTGGGDDMSCAGNSAAGCNQGSDDIWSESSCDAGEGSSHPGNRIGGFAIFAFVGYRIGRKRRRR
jgi:hypothetical protein